MLAWAYEGIIMGFQAYHRMPVEAEADPGGLPGHSLHLREAFILCGPAAEILSGLAVLRRAGAHSAWVY